MRNYKRSSGDKLRLSARYKCAATLAQTTTAPLWQHIKFVLTDEDRKKLLLSGIVLNSVQSADVVRFHLNCSL